MKKSINLIILVITFIFLSMPSAYAAENLGTLTTDQSAQIDDSLLVMDLSTVSETHSVKYWIGKENPIEGSFEADIITDSKYDILYATPKGIAEFPLVKKFIFERNGDFHSSYTIQTNSYDIILGTLNARLQYPNGNYKVPGDHQMPAFAGWLPIRWAFEDQYNFQYIPEKQIIIMTKR